MDTFTGGGGGGGGLHSSLGGFSLLMPSVQYVLHGHNARAGHLARYLADTASSLSGVPEVGHVALGRFFCPLHLSTVLES